MSRNNKVSALLFIINSEKQSENAEKTNEGRSVTGWNAYFAVLVPVQNCYSTHPGHTPSVNYKKSPRLVCQQTSGKHIH